MSERSGQGDASVSPSATLQKRVREFLQQRRTAGNAYVTASMVVNEFDITPQKAGVVLAKLAEAGDLDPWKNTRQASTTYRILVDEAGDPDA